MCSALRMLLKMQVKIVVTDVFRGVVPGRTGHREESSRICSKAGRLDAKAHGRYYRQGPSRASPGVNRHASTTAALGSELTMVLADATGSDRGRRFTHKSQHRMAKSEILPINYSRLSPRGSFPNVIIRSETWRKKREKPHTQLPRRTPRSYRRRPGLDSEVPTDAEKTGNFSQILSTDGTVLSNPYFRSDTRSASICTRALLTMRWATVRSTVSTRGNWERRSY
jgi:hypothetical protein